MSPAEFSDNMVPPIKQITDLHRVVTTWNTNRTTRKYSRGTRTTKDITVKTQDLGGPAKTFQRNPTSSSEVLDNSSDTVYLNKIKCGILASDKPLNDLICIQTQLPGLYLSVSTVPKKKQHTWGYTNITQGSFQFSECGHLYVTKRS